MATKKKKKTTNDEIRVGKTYRATRKIGRMAESIYTFTVMRIFKSTNYCKIVDSNKEGKMIPLDSLNNDLIKSRIEEVPKKNKKVMCEKCEVNPAEIRLINGQEQQCLCEICGQEAIYDLVMNNNSVPFVNNGVKANNLTELEIQ